MLLPLSGVTQVVQFPGDRYTYYAALPIVAALFFVLSSQPRAFALGAAIRAALAIAWTPTARSQVTVWWNTETLVQHSLALLRKDSYLRSTLAFRLAQARFDYRGYVAAAHAALHEAEQCGRQDDATWVNLRAQMHDQESVVAATGVSPVASNQRCLGRIFAAHGELREALVHFEAALRIAPAFAEARAGLEVLAPGTFATSHSPDLP